MRPGELSVMMLGMIWMPMWPAQVLVTQDSVRWHVVSSTIIKNVISKKVTALKRKAKLQIYVINRQK